MHLLILSVTAGEGHNSCAAALREAMEQRGHRVTVADLYRCCGVPRWVTDRIYRTCAKDFRRKYSLVYSRLEWEPPFRRQWERRFLPSWLYPRLLGYVRELRPDCVVAMHVFAALVLTRLRQRGELNLPILGVNTDYCLHPYWEDCAGLDGLVIPTPELGSEAEGRGISPKILLPLGIPIRDPERFSLSREEARERLGLDTRRLVLLMGGSMGYGHIFSIALALRRAGLPTVCVCGRNRKLYTALLPYRSERFQVLGFTKRLAEYMAAADLAVTKPGGLSLAELAAAGVPPILTRPIPGHEERNLRLWTRLGAALPGGETGEETAALAARLLEDEDRLRTMGEALRQLSAPRAAENLSRFVEALDKAGAYR